jgi:N6-L-threonylcarbamoyladenine synthase
LNKQGRYVKGFQLFDAVKWNNREGFVFGRRATGSFDIRKLDGKKLSGGVNCKYLRQIGYPRSVLTERREAHSANA